MANTLNLGTMTLDGKPASMGFAGARLSGQAFTLTDTIMGHELSWVIVGNMLIASHCLLRDLSFNDLDDIGLVEPQTIRLDGRDFIMRLPQVGRAPGLPNEWDSALDAAGEDDDVWHWSDMRCWGSDRFLRIDGMRPVRGETARGWFYAGEDDWENNGWRPVLEPVAVEFNDDLIGKTISIWNGQEILDGQLVSYNDYDLCLIRCMPCPYGSANKNRTWFSEALTGETLVDRAQVGIIQLREEKVIGNG